MYLNFNEFIDRFVWCCCWFCWCVIKKNFFCSIFFSLLAAASSNPFKYCCQSSGRKTATVCDGGEEAIWKKTKILLLADRKWQILQLFKLN
jgi:hypothetical protein